MIADIVPEQKAETEFGGIDILVNNAGGVTSNR
jgi:hypothetical protein